MTMSTPQGILDSYYSLLRAAHQLDPKEMFSTTSKLSKPSSIDEFISAKIDDLGLDLANAARLRIFFRELFELGTLPLAHYQDSLHEVEGASRQLEREYIVLKRQRKFIEEDLADAAKRYSRLDVAYDFLVNAKLMATFPEPGKSSSVRQAAFRRSVVGFYNASKLYAGTTQRLTYCHLTGWHPEQDAEAAHIVPESLQSEELSYLFGVSEALLSDPRNGKYSSQAFVAESRIVRADQPDRNHIS